jgi:hypothetical protein
LRDIGATIPVLDDAARPATCLTALDDPSYPNARYGVIVADDGASDDIAAVRNCGPASGRRSHADLATRHAEPD